MSKAFIPKVYDPKQIEKKWYEYWEQNGYFKPVDNDAPRFSIVMPPPNVTGRLHIGHALDTTWQDIIVRFKRQQGFNTLWIPGTDHAGIATQRKVRDYLRENEGLDLYDLGREQFVERVWEWKHNYGGTITQQIRQMGASCDWTRERFTMDEGCSRAVREAFVTLYEDGLLYRGDYIVHWCPDCGTTLSDIEVEHMDRQGKLYHVAYPLADGSGEIVVATTRPETILGDVAVAVNPKDKRYRELIGKECVLPIIERRIPIIADDYVDMEFGTGAVKVTPAHDPNDFQIGLRHDLPRIVVMNLDATMNQEAGPYAGMERYECRKAILRDLDQQGFLRHDEDHQHAVGHCYRCDTIVEPMLMRQWFVKMEPLAEKARAAAEKKDVRFIPERFKKIYLHWLENIRDWCVSRQIWWGHPIPAWYCECGEVIVSREEPDTCPSCGSKNLEQDPDVLDTWFSSALWPFSTQGWPEVKPEEMPYYPTTALQSGYDILFFWDIRMIMMGLHFTGTVPFRDLLLHGLVRDAQGRKMSKSLGNGIDPIEVIEQYGADALRLALITGNTPGNDMRFYYEKVEASRNFANKIWNAARFVLMNLGDFSWQDIDLNDNLTIADKWILSRYNDVVADVTRTLQSYEFGEAARNLYDFLWSEYCDWYIEMAKPRLYGEDESSQQAVKSVLVYVLSNTLRLLHPFMPFITEELWQALPHSGETIMVGGWPEYDAGLHDPDSVRDMEIVMEAVRSIRNIRQQSEVKPQRKITAIVAADDKQHAAIFEANAVYLKSLAGIGEYQVTTGAVPVEQAMSTVVTGVTIYLPLADMVDLDKELERLEKERQTLMAEVKRAQGKLNNPGFVSKAPQEIVEKERSKLADYQAKLQAVEERIRSLEQL